MQETTTVSDNVRAEVARAKVTQIQLAEHLGISQQAVSAKLAGRTSFSVAQLLAVAELLNVPASTLLGVAA